MTLLSTLLSTAVGIGTRAVYDLGKRHYDRSGRQARRARSDVDDELKARVEQELEARGIPEVQEELALRVLAEMQRRGLVPGEEQGQQEEPDLPTEPIPPAPFASAVVSGIDYDDDTGDLRVKFQDEFPGTNGPEYVYKDVPPYIYDIFKRGAVAPKTTGQNAWHAWQQGVSPSLGASLDALIKKGGFEYQKVA